MRFENTSKNEVNKESKEQVEMSLSLTEEEWRVAVNMINLGAGEGCGDEETDKFVSVSSKITEQIESKLPSKR